MKRRQDKKNAEDRTKAQAAEAQRLRREHRKNEREKLRIAGIQEQLLQVIEKVQRVNYEPSVKVLDIRNYSSSE